MTDTIASQNIVLSSWITLYKTSYKQKTNSSDNTNGFTSFWLITSEREKYFSVDCFYFLRWSSVVSNWTVTFHIWWKDNSTLLVLTLTQNVNTLYWVCVVFRCIRQNCDKRLLASSCFFSLCPHGPTLFPLDGCSWNLIFWDFFSKICRENLNFT